MKKGDSLERGKAKKRKKTNSEAERQDRKTEENVELMGSRGELFERRKKERYRSEIPKKGREREKKKKGIGQRRDT